MQTDQCQTDEDEASVTIEPTEGGITTCDEGVSPSQAKKDAAITLRQLIALNRCDTCDLHKNCVNANNVEQNNVDGVGPAHAQILLVFDSIVDRWASNNLQNSGPQENYVGYVRNTLGTHLVRKTGCIRCASKTTGSSTLSPVMRFNHPTVRGYFKSCKLHLINEIDAIDPKVVFLFGPGPYYSIFNKTDINETKVGGIYKKDGRIYIYTNYQKHTAEIDPMFKSLVNKVPFLLQNKDLSSLDIKIKSITDVNTALTVMEQLKSAKALAFDFEVDMNIDSKSNGFKPTDKLLGVGLSWSKTRSVFIPLDHDESPFKDNLLIKQKLKELLLSDVPKIGHNLGFDVYCAWHFLDHIEVNNLAFDTMLAHHLLDPTKGTHSLKHLSTIFTEFGGYEEELQALLAKLDKETRSFGLIPIGQLGEYCNIDCIATFKLYEIFKHKVMAQPKLQRIFERIVMPTLEMVLDIKKTPWIIDVDKLHRLEDLYKKKIDAEVIAVVNNPVIKKFNKQTINLKSPPQLSDLLFAKLGLRAPKLTKSKKPSVDAATLKVLLRETDDADIKDLLKHILNYKQYSTLVNTFMKGLKNHITPEGTIISEYLVFGTETCRLSSRNPNLQNIPSDLDIEDKEESVKGVFVAPKKHSLLVADYSQIELRNLGNISCDSAIVKTFTSGANIHKQTTANIFNIAYDDVDKESSAYRVGKTVNFAGVYGAGPSRLADQLDEKSNLTNVELEVTVNNLIQIHEPFRFGLPVTKVQSHFVPKAFFKETGLFSVIGEKITRRMLLLILSDGVLQRMKAAWPGAEMWKTNARGTAKQHGFTVSPFGRVRKVVFEKYGEEQVSAWNISINTPIQSVSSDCLLLALSEVHKMLKPYRTRIVGTVHDSGLFYLHEDERFLIPEIKNILEKAPVEFMPDFFKIPLEVEFKEGTNWANTETIVVE